MSKTILVYSEASRNIPELITAARSLGDAVTAFVVGSRDEACRIAAMGVDRAICASGDASVPAEAYAGAIAKSAADMGADTVLIGATSFGRAVAGMVAQRLGAPCASDCRSIESVDGGILISRSVYGGKAESRERIVAPTVIATIPLRSFEAAEGRGESAPVEYIDAPEGYPVKIAGIVAKEGDAVDVAAADSLVVIGRGCSKEGDLQMAQELADALGGVVACTRPVAEDYRLLPTERYIGMSGKQVAPNLLVCVGASGQVQCLAGASDSKVIVGINTDESAPLASYSDYFVNADLHDVVPEIIKAVKAL